MLVAVAAQATTIVLPTDEQLIAKTPVIVDGTVLSTTAIDRDGAIWTETVVEVARVMKGSVDGKILDGKINIREIGGTLDDRITKLFGTPEFAVGEHVLLFLEPSPHGGYRTMDLYVGKFSRGEMRDGRQLWMRDDLSQDVTLLDVNLQPLHAKNIQRDALAFETFVRERVAGRAGTKNYGVENPILREAAIEHGTGSIQSEFELISEPTIYRWFRFASGQSAQWFSAGTQPGYADGGVSELRTAMGVWTNYSSAAINYSYVGTRSGTMGGLDAPNGVNEVLFNDPLNEISGTWNRNTGGVVGTGGFNGVSSRQSWTATFAADAAHPSGTLSAWNITEGNLTIQDGVSSLTGITSKVLAEIVAHEFGHTLGFGHSDDPSALMFASVTGLGPSLRTDDQTAARWLYPNGNGGTTTPPPPPPPPVPAAPTDLRALVSNGSIDLSWIDNASNETGHAVYLATGTGAFSKVADVGANVRSTRLNGVSSGSYRIYVVAYNAAGDSAHSNTATATIAAAPVASFSMTPQSGAAGVTSFTFYDESTGGVTSRLWDFGDGGSSSALVATHVYATSGLYTVTLTVNGAGKSSSTSKTVNVTSSIIPFRTLVSVATYGGGVGGTAWRTELNLFNAGSQSASVSVAFLPSAGGDVRYRSVFLAPKQLETYENALIDLFGIATGAGALAIDGTSAGASADLRVSSRTFTTSQIGTYGQSVPDLQSGGLALRFITGIATNASFRTNIGLVNKGPTPLGVSLKLYSRTGSTLSSKAMTLPGHSFQQAPLASFFPEVDGASHDVLTMHMSAQSNDVSAYASVVDNITQDPIYLQGQSWETGSALTIPVVGRAPGANGTFWRSDLTLYNPGSSSLTLTLRYAGATRTVSLGANDTTVLSDVLSQFGLASGSGALQVTWPSSTGPVVTSRTYTTAATGGTYGQSIDPVAEFARRVFVPGLRNDGSYRSNIGFVNGGSEPEVFAVTLLSPAGTELARSNVTLAAGQQMQTSVTALFPNASLPAGFTLQAEGDTNAKLFAYGSMVDNASGDPVFFGGR
jgi:PKD repeat protein